MGYRMKFWTNDFTKECNKFLTGGHELDLIYHYGTYLWGYEGGVERDRNNTICFRVPGATRGHIKVVDCVITDIVFYEDTCFGEIGCYKREIEPHIKGKFLGTKFDLPIVDFKPEVK